jgi:hypothetical protein
MSAGGEVTDAGPAAGGQGQVQEAPLLVAVVPRGLTSRGHWCWFSVR